MIKEILGKGQASAMPVMRLLWTYVIWIRPYHRQLTELHGNLSDLIDPAIDSLCVFP